MMAMYNGTVYADMPAGKSACVASTYKAFVLRRAYHNARHGCRA